MTVFRVIVAGSREFTSYAFLKEKLDKILSSVKEPIEIISGTANGADVLGELYAKEKGYKLTRMPADWSLGRKAGPLRNQQMAIYASAEGNGGCVVFWLNQSSGSKNMIDNAKKYNLKLRVIEL